MKVLLYWFDSHGLDYEEFEGKDSIDFDYCDYKLWKLVQDGLIVTICKVDEEK